MRSGFVNDIKISVIVTVYNVGAYIRKCIDTITNQTLREIEIICIDDCSDDESYKILQDIAAKDKRIILFKNPLNLGAAPSRNIGLQIAQGEYVSILDGDDYYELDMLEVMYESCKRNSADISICGYEVYDNANGKRLWDKNIVIGNIGDASNCFNIYTEPDTIYMSFSANAFAKLYKREFLLYYGFQFQSIPNSNDVYFFITTMAMADKIVYIPKKFIHYRYNRRDSISKKRDKNVLSWYEACLKSKNFLELHNLLYLVRKSFNDFCLGSMKYNMSCFGEDNRSKVVDFMNSTGFDKLSLGACDKSDFCNPDLYNYYIEIRSKVVRKNDENNIEYKDRKEGRVATDSIAKYVFPFHKFSYGDKVAIYGSGEIGQKFSEQIIRFGYVSLIGVFDESFAMYKNKCVSVQTGQALCAKMYDFVILATEDEAVAKKMKDSLLCLGIREECIVWYGESYRTESFINENLNLYQRICFAMQLKR